MLGSRDRAAAAAIAGEWVALSCFPRLWESPIRAVALSLEETNVLAL